MKTNSDVMKRKRSTNGFVFTKKFFERRHLELFRMNSDSESDGETEKETKSITTPNPSKKHNSLFRPLEYDSLDLSKPSNKAHGRRVFGEKEINARSSPQFFHEDKKISRFVERIGMIRRSIGIKTEKVLFDNKVESFDNRTLNSKLFGKSGVLFVLIGDGFRLGCYQDCVIGPLKQNSPSNFFSNAPFIFCVRETRSVSETVMKRINIREPNITLYPNTNRNLIFTCVNAFTIAVDGVITISQTVKNSFNFREEINPFTDSLKRNTLHCKRFLAIQFL